MSNHSASRPLAAMLTVVLAGTASAAVPDLSTASSIDASAVTSSESACGSDNARALTDAPQALCSSGAPSALSGNGPWSWSCNDGQHDVYCTANAAAHYTFRTLDYPGASWTKFWGINDFGDLAGEYRLDGSPIHAMTYSHGRFASLDPNGLFGDRGSASGGPNDLGALCGFYTDESQRQHGFVQLWGFLETVDFPGHLNSNCDDVNVFGAIAGVYWDASGIQHGVLRNYGRDTAIDYPGALGTYPLGIDNSGVIVGMWYTNPSSTHGFLRDARGHFSPIDVPIAGPGGTITIGINDAQQMVGYYMDASNHYHGFLETHGQFQYLDAPDAVQTFPTHINSLGVIVGYYIDAANQNHGFIATPW